MTPMSASFLAPTAMVLVLTTCIAMGILETMRTTQMARVLQRKTKRRAVQKGVELRS
jgi:hypothetical protein